MAGMCTDLKDKVVIVTGASVGIGSATAIEFAKLGSSVVITGRNTEGLNDTASKCIESGLKQNQVLSIAGDITDAELRLRLVKDTVETFGKIDCLVNNAGTLYNGSIMELGIDKFDHTFNVNVRSVVELTKECVPHIIKTKGSIVNVSSICGTNAFWGVGYYCMTKSALDQFTKCLALELAEHGVRVNSVNPAMIDTAIFVRSGISTDEYAQMTDHCKNTHPLGRIGQPAEVGRAFAFLASEAASFTTGNQLFIDGGYDKNIVNFFPKNIVNH